MTEVPAHRLKQAKRALRREILAERDRVPEGERAAMSAAIADRLLAMDELSDAKTVMAFWSFGSEVDTIPLLERLEVAGAQVALPRIEDHDVEPIAYAAGDPLSETSFGAEEPASGRRLEPSGSTSSWYRGSRSIGAAVASATARGSTIACWGGCATARSRWRWRSACRSSTVSRRAAPTGASMPS